MTLPTQAPAAAAPPATGLWAALCLAAFLAAMAPGGRPAEAAEARKPAFKVAIFAPPVNLSGRENPYGAPLKIIMDRQIWGRRAEMRFFPADALLDPAGVRDAITALAGETDVKALVLGASPPGSLEGCARLRAVRPDILIIALDPQEDRRQMAQTASLTIVLNHAARGFLLPTLAKRMGALALIRFSSPRHRDQAHFMAQKRAMTKASADLGLTLLGADYCPDPAVADRAEVEAYITNALATHRKVFGDRLAFYGLDDLVCEILMDQAVKNGGLALDPVYPSLFWGPPEALNLAGSAKNLFGHWKRLLTLIDEKYIAMNIPGQISVWACPYPQTAILAAADLAVANLERRLDIYELKNITAALEKYSPGEKWQVNLVVDYDHDQIMPNMVTLLADSYWLGHGYQGFPRLSVPARYLRLK